ncbi:intradiol ring-cleavage dioxygenase [Streptomyces sp. NBC_01506]|uniref:dioxygenase family protein n=1 Tax=Streptomyces sp. NBC_01506 TaxID=2903887 RepID=UPI00386EFEFB
MHLDDEPVGRVLSRRQAITLLGTAGAALTVAGSGAATAAMPTSSWSPSGDGRATVDCIAKPEQTEGPYFVDEKLDRSDIRSDPSDGTVAEGAVLALNLGVLKIGSRGCTPLKNAIVDIWQCDALGVYSDVADAGTVGKKFLRGYQTTDRAGKVRFVTILPGWYAGRTVHFHVKVRTTGTDGNPYEFTSQLYVPDAVTAAYLAREPYASKGPADTTNATDRFYAAGGDQMLLDPRRTGRGYTADFTIGLDLSDAETGDDDGFEIPPGPAPTPPA